jgi:predicted phosphodiesterase
VSSIPLRYGLLFAWLSCASADCYRHRVSPTQKPSAAQPARSQASAPSQPPSAAGALPPTAASSATLADAATGPLRPLSSTQRGLRVAFLGDQGLGDTAKAVLQLVAREKADALVHLGDFAYDEAAPAGWDAQVDGILGHDFPYFAAIGNHDVGSWPGPGGFAELLSARLARIPDARCSGEYGVNALCSFRGLDFVLSGVGTYGSGHEAFLEASLAQSNAAFRLCIWHKNQHDMQTGAKTDEVGWQAYRICAHHAAIVITGHEHTYARSKTLAAIGDRSSGHGALGEPDQLLLAADRTVVFVAGLGGESARPRTEDHLGDSWWASSYAQNYQLQNGQLTGSAPDILFGALFIDFNVDDDPYRATGYFKTTDDQVQDRFTIQVPHAAAR